MAEADSKHANRTQASHTQTGRNRAGRQPISRHPLFPAIVALWFAALLGTGSFALSTSLLENLVLAGHVDSVIPAAAPPLGVTARLMLALVLGLTGSAIGWLLAKRLAAPKTQAAPQVFNVAEADLGPQWPGVAEAPLRPEPAPAALPVPALDPSSLVVHAAESVAAQEVLPAPPTHTAAQRIAAADLAELSHVELVERLAIALQRREELLIAGGGGATETANPVLQFPDLADRRSARLPLPPQSRPVPQETEKALREALAQLERMSGTA